jgi:putative transcriptional regulator
VAWQWTRWIFATASLSLSATLLHAALPPDTSIPDRTWLTGQLLIAAPQLRQPAFNHAVILVVQHNREGAFGIVINRPAEKRPIARMLTAFGADSSGIKDSVRVFSGGPIDPAVALVVHSADYRLADTMDIDGRVSLSTAADILRDIGLGKGPHQSLIAFGYAGWTPLQLEDEIRQGAWVTVPEDPALVFDDDRGKVWSDALAQHKASR